MRWSYKTVHYELKKEGLLGSTFLDESEVELSFNEYGRAGWELISILETMDGIIAVFKQPLTLDAPSFSTVESERDAHKKVEQEPITDITDKEAESEVVELDDFEVVEVDSKPEEPAEKRTPLPKREVGTIRIE